MPYIVLESWMIKPMITKLSDPVTWEIKIKGHLEERWSEWLGGLAFTYENDSTTTLFGALPDQISLHSVLLKIRDMNLTLISITQKEPKQEDQS